MKKKIIPISDLNNKNDYISIPENIYLYFKQRDKIDSRGDDRTKKVEDLLTCSNNKKISCRKLAELYMVKYKEKISKTVVNQILRNKLGYRFLKTNIKNKIITTIESKKQAFFVLKIIIRHLKLGGYIIFIDESTFTTVNNNYKTWRHPSEQIFFDYNDNGKRNLLLAISHKKVEYFKINDCNTTSEVFKNFFIELLNNLDESEIKNAIFFMDNATVHSTLDLMQFYSEKKLKILYNVPYVSYFNIVELCFRTLKNHIYKNLYSSINEVENDLLNLLKSEKIKNQLPLLFKETLKQYIKFIKDNINYNLNLI